MKVIGKSRMISDVAKSYGLATQTLGNLVRQVIAGLASVPRYLGRISYRVALVK